MSSRALLAVALSLGVPGTAKASGALNYRLTYAEGGRVRVEITVPNLAATQELVMPRAVPMGYGEQAYDRFVSGVAAVAADGQPLKVERIDGPRWRVAGPGVLGRVSYEVDVDRMEKEIGPASDTSKARPRYASLLGYSVFAYLDGHEDEEVQLEIRGPAGWPVFATLAPAVPPALESVRAQARSFYALADSQIALGHDLKVLPLPGKPPLYLAAYKEADTDLDLLGRLAREALDRMVGYFGSAPFPHYTVLVEFLKPLGPPHGYNFGMEHLESATFANDLTLLLPAEAAERDRTRWLYHLAHHVAHAWIPKRCYGEGYFPFTWELAPVLDTIWFGEGFAQYAAMVALAEGRPDAAAFRERFLDARFRQTLKETPAFLRRMSTVEISRLASTRYSEDFRTGRNSFSRGGLMAAEMDDLIRQKTGGSKSLRDALRHLMDWSEKSRRGFRVDELPELIRAGTGVDVRRVMDKWLAAQP
jgi:predicted metalloprotease with PDZ domain